MFSAEIFGRLAEISAAQPQMKIQKLEKRRVKIPKICIFFTKMGLKVSHNASKKQKIFWVVDLVLTKPQNQFRT